MRRRREDNPRAECPIILTASRALTDRQQALAAPAGMSSALNKSAFAPSGKSYILNDGIVRRSIPAPRREAAELAGEPARLTAAMRQVVAINLEQATRAVNGRYGCAASPPAGECDARLCMSCWAMLLAWPRRNASTGATWLRRWLRRH
jgi:hypothetical protein